MESYANGTFREVFKVTSSNNSLEHLVIKEHSRESKETMQTKERKQ